MPTPRRGKENSQDYNERNTPEHLDDQNYPSNSQQPVDEPVLDEEDLEENDLSDEDADDIEWEEADDEEREK